MAHLSAFFQSLFSKKKIRLQLCVLIAVFSSSSWIVIQGTFIELPLLVRELPEEWTLPSYLAVIAQVGNIGPVAYTLACKYIVQLKQEVPVIYSSIASVVVLTLILAFFWQKTAAVAGTLHSVSLMTLTFLLSLIACTTTLTYLPFMSKFKEEYLTAYFVGLGLCGLLPSLVALIQGVRDEEPRCLTSNFTRSGAIPRLAYGNVTTFDFAPEILRDARFGATSFFFFLVGMVACSFFSFLALNKLSMAKKEMLLTPIQIVSATRPRSTNSFLKSPVTACSSKKLLKQSKYDEHELEPFSMDHSTGVYGKTVEVVTEHTVLGLRCILWYLFLQAWMSGMMNGVAPALLSYAAIPYGNTAYHLAVTLSAIADPFSCFLYHWITVKSALYISILCLLYTILISYIAVMASLSPCPVLMGNPAGRSIIIIVALVSNGLGSYLMLAVSTAMHSQGRKALLWTGMSIQLGAFVAALIMSLLVNVASLFQQSDPCKSCIM